ncbi:SPX domain-containing protein [Triangularia verruculosa]|uniref:SPX domain-containing protein n=1 Tax=Triangularia verruculosa TaxID=2587418 RepID=A0AAN6X5U5_9PEZI|nr:SPX domain-containing protein [Triangularia verruculosa]
MKFGHAFKEALEAESYPRHWVDKAIPYRQLKKILGKVREELIKNGYDRDTIQRLVAERNAEYRFEPDTSLYLRPKLVVRPATTRRLSLDRTAEVDSIPDSPSSSAPSSPTDTEPGPSSSALTHDDAVQERQRQQQQQTDDDEWIDVPLDADARFFNIIQEDVNELDTLQDKERVAMIQSIHMIGNEIAQVARPRKPIIDFSRSDLYRWREILELYLSAEVFFSTNEVAGGARNSERARKQLVWFQDEVSKRQLSKKFKIKSSAVAFQHFLSLNATLLQNLQFQELNQTAVTKIIKKFDKRTSLGVKKTFPKVMNSAQFISESISKDVCAQLSRDVISLVPQVVDYTCIVCLSICWLPIRLDCTHLFCIRCMIKMQNRQKRFCPLCRADVIQRANETHIDMELVRYLERWFPKETKEKQRNNEDERRKELLGDLYEAGAQPPCIVM